MRPIVRYHGGKWLLAPWIISHFPEHKIYVEPFGGGASVLLRKTRAPHCEYYNDLDGDIVNLFRVLQNPETAKRLEQVLRVTPFARAEFNLAYEPTDDPIESARRTLIRSYMGFGSVGTTGRNTGFRSKSLRANSAPAKIWKMYPNSLTWFSERLQGIVIDQRPALEMIEHLDSKETLFYADPPYLAETRNNNSAAYRFEMSDNEHEILLNSLCNITGKIILSGYKNDLYLDILKDWKLIEKVHYAGSNSGSSIRTECLWISPNIEYIQQAELFT